MFKYSIIILVLLLSENLLHSSEFKFYEMSQAWMTYEKTDTVAGHPGVPDENWGLRLRRSIVGVKAKINDIFSYTFNLEFAYKDSPALDMYLNASLDGLFNVKLGQFIPGVQTKEATLVPTELMFYEYSDLALKTASYSGFTALRDLGLEFYGATEFFKYSAYIGNGTGRFNYNNTTQNITNRKLGDALYGVRLDFFPIKGLRFGGHFNINNQDSIQLEKKVVSYDRYTSSIGLGFSDFGIRNLFGEMDLTSGRISDRTIDSTALDFIGYQFTVGYKILKEFHALCRYEQFREDRKSAADKTYEKLVFGLSWYYYQDSADILKIALNYHIMNEKPVEINNNVLALLVQVKF